MLGLENSTGPWCTYFNELKSLVTSYFQEIYTSRSPFNIETITDCVHSRVTMQQNAALVRQISSKEIWLAVKAMHPTKSPSPDGFTGNFFQQYWNLWGRILLAWLIAFFIWGDYIELLTGHIWS